MARIRATQYYFHYLYQCNDLFVLIYGISCGIRPLVYSPIPTPADWEAKALHSLDYDAMVREGRFAQLMVYHVLIDPLQTRITRHPRVVSLLGKGFHTIVKCCAQQSSDTTQLAHKLHNQLGLLRIATLDPATGDYLYGAWKVCFELGHFVPVQPCHKIILASYLPIANITIIAFTDD